MSVIWISMHVLNRWKKLYCENIKKLYGEYFCRKKLMRSRFCSSLSLYVLFLYTNEVILLLFLIKTTHKKIKGKRRCEKINKHFMYFYVEICADSQCRFNLRISKKRIFWTFFLFANYYSNNEEEIRRYSWIIL